MYSHASILSVNVICEHVWWNPDPGLHGLDGVPNITPVGYVPPAKVSTVMQKFCNLPDIKCLQPIIVLVSVVITHHRRMLDC